MEKGLERYDVKILVVLLKSIEGRKDFFRWLIDNGYPELAAFSNAVRADTEALVWLSKQGYRWLAILSNAIDGSDAARLWLSKNLTEVNLMFALACRKDDRAIQWLQSRDLGIFLLMVREIHKVIELVEAEESGPYVLHRR